MKRIIATLFLVALLCISGTVPALSFGKNKVNYTPFDWKFIPTKNFDIYYTTGGYETALIASEFAEYSYESISNHWNYTLQKRIPILVYNSHNDFAQTNVIMEILGEGTGGFTELFKNRVVIPWEGSLDKFKHVIHHELTHAVMFDLLYGNVIDSIMGREYMFQVPLWFAEGLAEHESQYWSTEADMIVRDGIINGYLPPINQTYGGYLVYKGGESFFKFLQEHHGHENKWIAGELLHSLRTTKNVEKTFKSVLGESIEDLSKEWHRKLRMEHWPDVKDREIPEDFATRLTDHMEQRNYINMNPSFNPTGDKIAFLTDRNEYKEIMIMSALDGRILDTVTRGEKAGEYEEMHWLRGGISWSPDGSMVVFATKSGKKDAINIVKVTDDGYDKMIVPDMDAVYSPDWSPDGSRIVFSGIKNGKLDLFIVDIETEKYIRLTDDYFDEADPKWSPDGSQITFSSDRLTPPYQLTINGIYGAYNIFTVNADGSNVRQLTSNKFNDRSPDWSPDGKNIVFTSDRNGIVNLYQINLEEKSVQPLTNLLTGSATPEWSPDGSKIAFTSFQEGGWDIFLLKRPLKRQITSSDIAPTVYRTESLSARANSAIDSSSVILSNPGTGQSIAVETLTPKDYKIKFSPDMFNAFASYNTFMGFGGMGSLSLSDILGNHRINAAGNLYYSLEESNIFLSYYYLKRQTNYGISLYHYKTYYYSTDWDMFSDRVYGASLLASHPFSKFTRLDFVTNLLSIERDAYSISTYQYYDSYHNNYYPYAYTSRERLDGIRSLTLSASFSKDTTLWSYTGPANGTRYRLNVEHSPTFADLDLQYTTVEFDYRKYFRFNKRYTFVSRLSGGGSFGEQPRLFFLGGIDNWLNARVADVPSVVERSQDLFFAKFPFPLRGYRYYQEYGQKYFLTNFEFRFPFIRYLALGWPLPIVLGNITGTIFTDIGSAWERYEDVTQEIDGTQVKVRQFNESFHGGGRDANGKFYLDDIKMSWGVGMRMNLGFAVLRFDTAWKVFAKESDPKPVFYVSIGPDF